MWRWLGVGGVCCDACRVTAILYLLQLNILPWYPSCQDNAQPPQLDLSGGSAFYGGGAGRRDSKFKLRVGFRRRLLEIDAYQKEKKASQEKNVPF